MRRGSGQTGCRRGQHEFTGFVERISIKKAQRRCEPGKICFIAPRGFEKPILIRWERKKKASYMIPINSLHTKAHRMRREQNGHITESPKLYGFFVTNGFRLPSLQQEEGHDA